MRSKQWLCSLALAALFVLSGATSAEAKTQGFRECTELCYVKECGEVGVRCPTQTQKRMYRRMCYGQCKEKVRRQRVEEMLRIERERAARYRKTLILKHRLWERKKKVVAQIRMRYLQAKQQRRVAAPTAHYRRMLAAMHEQFQVMHQKLQAKEGFYQSRQQLRAKQRAEMQFQIKRLKAALQKAEKQRDKAQAAALKKKLTAQKRKEIDTHKKSAKLKLDFYKTRITRRKHEVKQLKHKRKSIKQAQEDAKKKKDKKKLEDLAKRLGELAGRQAAITRKADLEQIKLRQARLAYVSASKRSL